MTEVLKVVAWDSWVPSSPVATGSQLWVLHCNGICCRLAKLGPWLSFTQRLEQQKECLRHWVTGREVLVVPTLGCSEEDW